MGFECYLLGVLDGPDFVLAALCEQFKVHLLVRRLRTMPSLGG